jgi:hypothetical protein
MVHVSIFKMILKWLSNGITESVNMMMAKNDGLKEPEKGALKGFGEEVCQHLSGGGVTDGDIAGADVVFEPKMTNVYITRLGSSRCAAIGGQVDGPSIVLFKNI